MVWMFFPRYLSRLLIVLSRSSLKQMVHGTPRQSEMQVDCFSPNFLPIYCFLCGCISLFGSYATSHKTAAVFDVWCCCSEWKSFPSLCSTLAHENWEVLSHSKWYHEAVKLALSVNVDPSRPRTVQRQVHRSNTPAESVSQYYERTVTLPFLDHLTSQIQTRFSDRNMAIFNGFYAFPERVVSLVNWRKKFEAFLEECIDDLPEPRYLNTELSMWEDHCRRIDGMPPTTLSTLLPTIDKVSFPNIFTTMQLLATLPVTTCTCERSISVLRRLKTYLRNTMTENRLNGLALLNVHRDIHLDINEVIDCFAIRHPRRMKLLDILNSGPVNSSCW